MKYILLFVFIISCIFQERYDLKKSNNCEIIQIPVVFHFNKNEPPNYQKITDIISDSDLKLKSYGFEIKIASILFDAPLKLENEHYRPMLKLNIKKHINVYFVNDIVSNSTEYLAGIYYYLMSSPDSDYIVISSIASKSTLIHEFGHYFGLDHENKDSENIMNENRDRDNNNLHFLQEQINKMKMKLILNKMIKYRCYEKK